MQDMALAVKRIDAFETQNLRRAFFGFVGAAVLNFGGAGAGINFLHPAVGADRG